jgi:Flp pilus assembly protein TadB
VWAVRIAGVVVGVIVGLLQPPGLTQLLPAVILFLLPGQMLSTAYEKVSRRVRRELPEFAQSIALQSSLGKSIGEALTVMLKAELLRSRSQIRQAMVT